MNGLVFCSFTVDVWWLWKRKPIAARSITTTHTKDYLVLGQPKTKNILGYGEPCPKTSSFRTSHESGA